MGTRGDAVAICERCLEVAVAAGKVNTREDGRKDLKIGVILKRSSGLEVSPAEWERQRVPGVTIVLAFATITTVKVFHRSRSGWVRLVVITRFGLFRCWWIELDGPG